MSLRGDRLDMPFFRMVLFAPLSGSNSVVECNLAMVDVAGSNPVSRSIFVFGQSPGMGPGFGSGPLAQLVEQVTLNHKVVGSTPSRPTT